MLRAFHLAAIAVFALGLAKVAQAQSVTFDFENGTDQGFGHKFSDDASEQFPIVNIGGSQRMEVLRNGDFQEADRSSGNSAEDFYQAMLAASANEAGYQVDYDWYVDTSLDPGQYGSFLQLGTYVNTGSGFYSQHFPGTGKEVELNGTQLASGQVFSGHVTLPMSAIGDMPTGETFFRFGLIINGDGADAKVYYDNIKISPAVPEPATLALFGLAVPALALRRRHA